MKTLLIGAFYFLVMTYLVVAYPEFPSWLRVILAIGTTLLYLIFGIAIEKVGKE